MMTSRSLILLTQGRWVGVLKSMVNEMKLSMTKVVSLQCARDVGFVAVIVMLLLELIVVLIYKVRNCLS